ncbi:MAG TPA: RIP metalloprotease RseP [Beggiatoa sp.]|nr:MAG: RIP metalloprotease RseP [Beggiatoa sp. 4572_84]RKZ55929.1 MAG: RIP metalloprotease RseP [Gammaproteobacteria bacterium]HEW98872.1 RIP metalloprotease RseP [Beggiatoa sp.]
MTLIETLLAFIVVIGILVTVHEFGHYWVARRLGVKILRFSIGFGRPLWLRRFGKDETEFVIAAIPLGGYVKMLDENEGEVAREDLPRAFNRQSLGVRAAIVVAGPLLNFLFAIVAYTVMYMVGVTGMKALVGEVTPQSLAEQAGFQPGYQIVAINEQPAARWDSVIQATLLQMLDNQKELIFSVQNQQGHQYDLTLKLDGFTINDIAEGHFFDKLGIRPFRPSIPAVISSIMPDSAAERAGLRAGDKIIALDNQPIKDWKAWADYVSAHPDKKILAEIERDNQQIELTLTPDNVDGKGRMGTKYIVPPESFDIYFSTERYGLGRALLQGLAKTWDICVLTLRLMVKMLTLQVSHEHLSGPISIAQFAGQSAQLGLSVFLSFLGLVSVSLGVINLLPIPLLDGGHLLFYLIEWIKGNPVTEKTESLLQGIGMALLFCLMGLAIFNDLERLFS